MGGLGGDQVLHTARDVPLASPAWWHRTALQRHPLAAALGSAQTFGPSELPPSVAALEPPAILQEL